MAYQASLLLCWLLSLCDICVLLTAASRDETRASKRWILVRHGESVNNLLSQKHNIYQWWAENGRENKQDPVLSIEGQEQCISAGKILFGERRINDQYNLFRGGKAAVKYSAVYVSPMRRTLQTAILVFGRAAHAAGIPFKALPWAHEARKSKSDVGLGSRALAKFANNKAEADCLLFDEMEPLQTLGNTLEQLPDDWSTNPTVPDEVLPYYPKGQKKESDDDLNRRMQRLESEMLNITEDAAILVAHSGVIRWLLRRFVRNRKPDNVAMFYGELSFGGWNNVHFFGSGQGDLRKIEGLAEFMDSDKATDCSQGNCGNFSEQFAVLGQAKKCARGSVKVNAKGTTYEWVYDKVMKALTYFAVDKNPEEDKAKGTIYLQSDTTVWYTKEGTNSFKFSSTNSGKISPHDHQLTCDKACPLDYTVKDATAVMIFTEKTQKSRVQDWTCKEKGGCKLILPVEKPDKGEQLPAALKIAIAVACSRNETIDIADALQTNACEPEDEVLNFLKSSVAMSFVRRARVNMRKSLSSSLSSLTET